MQVAPSRPIQTGWILASIGRFAKATDWIRAINLMKNVLINEVGYHARSKNDKTTN
jgi:hypothetical protein